MRRAYSLVSPWNRLTTARHFSSLGNYGHAGLEALAGHAGVVFVGWASVSLLTIL